MTTQQDQALTDFMAQVQAHETERDQALTAGIPALHRLATIAQGDTGQCARVRKLLLGLYNGHRFPFDLTHSPRMAFLGMIMTITTKRTGDGRYQIVASQGGFAGISVNEDRSTALKVAIAIIWGIVHQTAYTSTLGR